MIALVIFCLGAWLGAFTCWLMFQLGYSLGLLKNHGIGG